MIDRVQYRALSVALSCAGGRDAASHLVPERMSRCTRVRTQVPDLERGIPRARNQGIDRVRVFGASYSLLVLANLALAR